jgi:hypothetical protein
VIEKRLESRAVPPLCAFCRSSLRAAVGAPMEHSVVADLRVLHDALV